MNKICIFDLDGTLIENNSHVDIVRKYYFQRIGFFVGIIEAVLAAIMPSKYQKYLDGMIKNIPDDYIKKYKFKYRESALSLLKRYKENNFKIIIISNAPDIIVKKASNELGVSGVSAPVGKKQLILGDYKIKNEYIVVITDNTTDIDLINISDESVIYVNKKTIKYFMDKLSDNKNVKYITK